MPRTPKDTVKTRRLPKVGDEITRRMKITRVQDDNGRWNVTIQEPWSGHKITIPVDALGEDEG